MDADDFLAVRGLHLLVAPTAVPDRSKSGGAVAAMPAGSGPMSAAITEPPNGARLASAAAPAAEALACVAADTGAMKSSRARHPDPSAAGRSAGDHRTFSKTQCSACMSFSRHHARGAHSTVGSFDSGAMPE
jgi:hypothetical protein